MKSKSILFYFFATISSLNLFGKETEMDMVSTFRNNPHVVSIGHDAFYLDFHSHIEDTKVHETSLFAGLNVGYEHLKPDAFYFGIDCIGAAGNPLTEGSSIFGNVELRFGYTFSGSRWLLTPFLSMGRYDFGCSGFFFCFEVSAPYLGGGFHSRYEISPLFNLGLNVKAFGSPTSDERWEILWDEQHIHHSFWGGEIAVPLTWRIGPTKRWDIQVEPYYLRLNFKEGQNVFGTRLLFDYHF